MDSEEQEKLKLLSKERAKKNVQARMSQISGGDFGRGFGTKKTEEEPIVERKKTSKKQPSEEVVETPKKASKTQTKEQVRATGDTPQHLGKIVVDSSAIDTLAVATNDSKRRRKKLIISVLVVAIVLIWAFIIFTKLIKPQKPNHNCHMYLAGNAKSDCVLLLDGEKNSEWRTPVGISPQCTYNDFKVELSLPAGSEFDVRFRVEVYNKNKLVSNFGTVDTLTSYVIKLDENGTIWREIKNVEGGQNLLIVAGLTFFDLKTTPELYGITSNNVKINIYIEVNKV